MSARKTHEQFVRQLNKINSNIKILGKYQKDNIKIQCECKACGYIWSAIPSNLLRGSGCRKCSIIKRRKLFAISQSDFIKKIQTINQNVDVIGEYINFHTKILCKCKLCNSEFYINPSSIFSYNRITCPVCSDGISYPNKYIRNFLKQLPIENLEFEWKLKNNKQYSYDNHYIYNDIEYIVEADGAQHYQKNKFGKWEPDEVQKRDNIKDKLASDQNIKVIRIDCQISEANYIKDKIISSELSSIFDLSNINWGLCNEESQNSLVRQVCDLYNNGYRNIDIVNKLHIDRHTVTRYLKAGRELGWCKYVNKFEKEVGILAFDKITLEKNMNLSH